MRSFIYSAIALVAAPLFVNAVPIKVRQTSSATGIAEDVLVFQFADILEQLETSFYTQALEIFVVEDFVTAGFSNPQLVIQQIQGIALDESTHTSVIEEAIVALGSQPLSGCTFDFSSVLVDVKTMAATARIVELVGVSAYLGASILLEDLSLLVAAASILTVEARHQTILNLIGGGTSIPQAFDIALSPSEVLAVASQFIGGCTLPIPANAALQITNQGPATTGTQLNFASTALNSSVSQSGFFCQMLVGGVPFSISLPMGQCVVPQGINGPVAIYITSDDQAIDADLDERNLNTVVAGPTIVFIDIETDILAEVIIGGSAGGSSSGVSSSESIAPPVMIGTSSTTISPYQASAILSSASAEATA